MRQLFPDANQDPGVMSYSNGHAIDTARKWSSANVRLGWTMEPVLTKSPGLFSFSDPSTNLRERMRAFEASLFMSGYDVACLAAEENAATNRKYERSLENVSAKAYKQQQSTECKTISPLSGHGTPIIYSGNRNEGFFIRWGSQIFSVDPEFRQDIESNLGGQTNVPLGASLNGSVPPSSLGQWIVDEGWPSRKYASAIAAILCEEGIASKADHTGRGIILNFSD